MNTIPLSTLFFLAMAGIILSISPFHAFADSNLHPKSFPRQTISISFNLEQAKLTGTSRITVPKNTPVTLHCGPLTLTGSLLEQKNTTPLQVRADADNIIRLPAVEQPQTLLLSWTLTPGNPYVSGNLISNNGITLAGFWHPMPEQDMLYELQAMLPPGFTGISEGEKVSITTTTNGRQLQTNFPFPLRVLHFAAGPYTVDSLQTKSGITIYSYFFKEDKPLAAEYVHKAAEYIQRFEQLIGPFPYTRYTIVENRLPTGYGMPGFTLLGQAVIRLPFIKDTSLGHEILHSWFGNSINLSEKGGNWCEGLTSYLADQSFADDLGKGMEYRKNQLLRYHAYVHAENEMLLSEFQGAGDNSPMAKKIRAIGYDKGSMVFHMLRKAIGDQAFSLGLRDLYAQKKNERASWKDIQEAFSRAMGTDLKPFFNQWLNRPDIPKLQLQKVNIEQKDGQSIITFHLIQNNTKPYILQVPIMVTSQTGSTIHLITTTQLDQEFSISTDTLPTEIILDPDYDLLRQLTEAEIPPVWSSFLGAEQKIVILPDDEHEASLYQSLADILQKRGAEVVTASELTNEDLSTGSFLFAGDSSLRRSLFANPKETTTGFSLRVRKNPLNISQTMVLVDSKAAAETKAVLGKLFHYGKYSHLRFHDGTNTGKEIDQSENGIHLSLYTAPAGLPSATVQNFSTIMQNIQASRVVYAGETHTAYGDHLLQLQILQALYAGNKNLALGMEMFPRAAQQVLDDYITGTITTEKDFIKKTKYFSVWGFDYRLYRPIIAFAKKHQLPIVGLNLDKKIVSQVFRKGHTDEISDKDLATLALERDLDVPGYHDRLQDVHAMHASSPHGTSNFSGFLQAQALWDETMAESISTYLLKHPDKNMVIIAGNGHVYKDSAIPLRVKRRLPKVKQSVLSTVNGMEIGLERGKKIDYLMFTEPEDLPPAPKVGVVLKEEKNGSGEHETNQIRIIDISPHGKGKEAGLEKDDVILTVDDEPVYDVADLKLALLDKKVGETITVKVFRERVFFPDETLKLTVELTAMPTGGMMPLGHPKK